MANLHPKYRQIKVVMTNGTEFTTRSTYSKDVLTLDIDPFTHPAYQKKGSALRANERDSRVQAFRKKFQNVDFMSNV